ncbi:hypothetical protein V5799_011642 [Amblyomma americanum]|uniref:Uncharacterized protein n=1 Tax=Amblyomma americanum TaxID=6943 RepID=A0AAQ4EG96_AMBAM
MDVLKKKRKAVTSQATRLTKETDDILAAEEAPTNEKVSVLLERLRLVKQQLNDVDAAIEPNVKDDEAEAEFEQVIEYGDKIATCICRLNLKKEQTEQASKDKEIRFQATVGSASAAQRIKLPKLELTKFDGKRKNWQPFWEQFEVAVHKDTELSNIDRLNYLKTLLTGGAVTAIAGLQASALVQDHMQGLVDVKPVFSARNVRALRGLYDEIQVHMLGLKTLGIEDDGYQAMLYPVLLRALPKELILDYHRSHAENQEEATPAVVDDSGSTTSSSDSSQLTPLHSLLRFFRFELESRERTLEDRPDDAHGDFTAEELEKKREVGVLNSTSDKEDELLDLEDFSSASRVNRVTAWIFRFVQNLRSSDRISGPLTAAEFDHAKGFWMNVPSPLFGFPHGDLKRIENDKELQNKYQKYKDFMYSVLNMFLGEARKDSEDYSEQGGKSSNSAQAEHTVKHTVEEILAVERHLIELIRNSTPKYTFEIRTVGKWQRTLFGQKFPFKAALESDFRRAGITLEKGQHVGIHNINYFMELKQYISSLSRSYRAG